MSLNRQTMTQGARIVLRDAEWLVRSIDGATEKGQKITVVGISEIVRDKERIFITDYEKSIQILDPVNTELVRDKSPRFIESRLYLESLIRQAFPTGNEIVIGDKCAADTLPFQLDPAHLALSKPRQRILIADGVGLGKTIEAGILVSELIKRGRGKRILVVATKSMLSQFQKEFWVRFTIPLTRLDSQGIQKIRSKIPANQNPFFYYDKSIISIDTLKQQYRTYLEQAYWDIIIIDEAHNVATRGQNQSMRAGLAKLLSQRSDTLIMLSATPHDGRAQSFASLMKMLDRTAIPSTDDFTPDDIKGLFVRRLKKDFPNVFKEKQVERVAAKASCEEEQFFEVLAKAEFKSLNKREESNFLFLTLLKKGVFSSPEACAQIIRNKIKKLSGMHTDDLALLNTLLTLLEKITPASFSKYQQLLKILKTPASIHFWNGKEADNRLVIFTESRVTLEFLENHLVKDLGLKKEQVAVMHGSLSDTEQQKIVEEFGNQSSSVRLLLTTDVASEGINLHFFCHRLIHFDMPWSLMVYQQRSGRIDRYGQELNPILICMITETQQTDIAGDIRILEVLQKKDEQANKNIGDPLSLEIVYSEEATRQAMEEKQSVQVFDEKMDIKNDNFDDFLKDIFSSPQVEHNGTAPVKRMPSLFKDDFSYLTEALSFLYAGETPPYEISEKDQIIELKMPESLKNRFTFYPSEIPVDKDVIKLSTDKKIIKLATERARVDGGWPDVQYLWPLNPVMSWVQDRVHAKIRRNVALVITLPGFLPKGDAVVVMAGHIPNRKGQSLIQRQFCVHFSNGKVTSKIELLEDFIHRTKFGQEQYPNRGVDSGTESLSNLLKPAIEAGQQWMLKERDHFKKITDPQLKQQQDELEALYEKHRNAIEKKYQDQEQGIKAIREKKRENSLREIKDTFDEQKKWIKESIETDEQAHFQIMAIIEGG